MLRQALRESLTVNWGESRVRSALPCIAAIAISLSAGLACGRPAAGMVAAGGAMSVGFGAFQRLGRSRILPMWWASLGMCLATALGSCAGHSTTGVIGNAAAAGFLYGWLSSLGQGVGWITLQCAIFSLVATGYPAGGQLAVERALLVLAGGLLQLVLVLSFRRLHTGFIARVPQDTYAGVVEATRTLRANLRANSDAFRYAWRLSATLALAAFLARFFQFQNGYWVPMTALLVLRTKPHETLTVGLARMVGTLVGAGLATFLVTILRPGPETLAALVVLFAWLCYSVINVNYGAFAVSITAYIAFLLALGGLPEREVALHRIVNTSIGGALALVVSILALWSARRSDES